jgi:hypothetical protein
MVVSAGAVAFWANPVQYRPHEKMVVSSNFISFQVVREGIAKVGTIFCVYL